MTRPPAPRPSGGAPLPDDELDRLRSLSAYALIDTPSEPEYDELTALAAELCETPMAALSVLEIGRQWFKASVGMPVRETRRDVSFCAWAVLDPARTLVVPDARLDERFADYPSVTGERQLRFYAGVPLLSSDEQPLGALCVLDTRPRTLTDAQLSALRVLANQVVAQLELRRSLLEGARLRERLAHWEDLVSGSWHRSGAARTAAASR